jgi:hypothetical protein
MITGIVTVRREAIIRVLVHGPGGQRQRVEAVIDTGFIYTGREGTLVQARFSSRNRRS